MYSDDWWNIRDCLDSYNNCAWNKRLGDEGGWEWALRVFSQWWHSAKCDNLDYQRDCNIGGFAISNKLDDYNFRCLLVFQQELKSEKGASCNKNIFAGGDYTMKKGDKDVVKKLPPLKIANARDAGGDSYIDSYQGKYPVIFISLKDVVGGSVGDVEIKLKELVASLYEQYTYLSESTKLSTSQKTKLQKYIDQDYTGITLEKSIKFLSELLHKHHNQRVYILVDEYDKPVNHFLEKDIFAEDRTLIKDITELITTILSTCGKGNEHLEKIVLTGIFDTVKKEGNSGFNNVKAFGISDQSFSESFGFSDIEVQQLVRQFSFQTPTNILTNIKAWYNGYTVPISLDTGIQKYTPWAVMSYLNDISNPHKGENYPPQNYWTQSGYSKILEDLLRKEACIESDLSGKFGRIAEQGFIELKFDQQISLCRYYGLKNMVDIEEIFSYLLLNSGYLTMYKANSKYSFSIPNLEVKREFERVIKDQMHNKECIQGYQELLDKLSHKKIHAMHLEVFDAIKKQDMVKLEGIFKQNPALQCDDKDLNFNYFHIAAIVGNKDVFSLLVDKCDMSLLYQHDKKLLQVSFLLYQQKFLKA